MPNMVRNERSLCAHSVRKVWPKMSSNIRISDFLGRRKCLTILEQYGWGKRNVPGKCQEGPGLRWKVGKALRGSSRMSRFEACDSTYLASVLACFLSAINVVGTSGCPNLYWFWKKGALSSLDLLRRIPAGFEPVRGPRLRLGDLLRAH